jgi:steroid 5-alpha reductase family enzyme
MLLATTGSFADFCLSAGVAAATEVVVFLVAFGCSRILGRHSVVDVFWGLSFVAVAATTFATARGRSTGCLGLQVTVLVLVAVWGLRLSGYLAIRQRGGGEDPRYVWIMKGAKGRHETAYALRTIYGLQMVLAWIVSLPVTAAMVGGPPIAWIAGVGVAVYAVGLTFEALGDAQLRRFKADPANAGRVMDRGLWSWTRHPNYFGDATVWWGVWIVAASSGLAVLSVAGPIAMTWLLTSVSGRPLLEKSLSRSKDGWDDYVARTSSFLPRPPRR